MDASSIWWLLFFMGAAVMGAFKAVEWHQRHKQTEVYSILRIPPNKTSTGPPNIVYGRNQRESEGLEIETCWGTPEWGGIGNPNSITPDGRHEFYVIEPEEDEEKEFTDLLFGGEEFMLLKVPVGTDWCEYTGKEYRVYYEILGFTLPLLIKRTYRIYNLLHATAILNSDRSLRFRYCIRKGTSNEDVERIVKENEELKSDKRMLLKEKHIRENQDRLDVYLKEAEERSKVEALRREFEEYKERGG